MNYRMHRIDADGLYRSPNVCFIDDEKDTASGEVEADEEVDADEGADEPEGDEESDGAEADEGSEEDGGGSEEGSAEGAEGEVEKPRARTFRDEKKDRKAAQARADALERDRAADRDRYERELATERRRAEEAERRADARRADESAAAEAARVELMSDGERLAHYRQKDRQEYEGRLNGIQFQVWDSADSAKFERLVDRNPLYAKVRDKVEAEFDKFRREGKPVPPRETLAELFIGRMVVANSGAAKTKQKTRAAEGIRRETTKPQRARSAAPGERQRRGTEDSATARRKRLENVTL